VRVARWGLLRVDLARIESVEATADGRDDCVRHQRPAARHVWKAGSVGFIREGRQGRPRPAKFFFSGGCAADAVDRLGDATERLGDGWPQRLAQRLNRVLPRFKSRVRKRRPGGIGFDRLVGSATNSATALRRRLYESAVLSACRKRLASQAHPHALSQCGWQWRYAPQRDRGRSGAAGFKNSEPWQG
jgi:hypothetical protein